MNLRDLKYLIALSEHRHFGKAAKACFVSQPALSMQIKKLEDTLGVQLLERTQKSMLLTDIGNTIVQHAQTILVHADEIREMAKQARDPESGEIRMGLFPTLAPYLLPHIFPKICQPFPNLEIYLVESKTQELLEKLRHGKLDATLLALPLAETDLTSAPLFEEEFHLAVSPTHPLAKKNSIQLSDLENQPLLLLEEGHCLRDQALSFCQKANTRETKRFYATSLETLRHMVAANLGITLMPILASRPNDNVTYVPFEPSQKPSRTIGLVWRTASARSSLFKKLADQIRDLVGKQRKIVKLLP